jgi:hypothetical protein
LQYRKLGKTSVDVILPNSYMPTLVRLGHSFELFTSMFVFGILSIIIFKSKFDINALGNRKSNNVNLLK